MRVIISNTARGEIARQIAYIQARNPDAARTQRARISQAVALLRDTPRLGKPGRVAGTRELVIAGTPFLLIYALGDNRLEILHLKHGRQQWPPEEEEEEDEPQ